MADLPDTESAAVLTPAIAYALTKLAYEKFKSEAPNLEEATEEIANLYLIALDIISRKET